MLHTCSDLHNFVQLTLLHILFSCAASNEISTIESLQFDFATIEAATNKFSDDKQLGEGGFGRVYKVHAIFSLFAYFLVTILLILLILKKS